MARIVRSFIDDLIGRVDVVDYINQYVPLKKAGRNYQACCPFHNEKSPSFSVAQDKQFYHCFGCGAHGNVISFAIEHLKLEFVEAVEELASYAGVEVQYEQGGDNKKYVQQKSLTDVMAKVAKHFYVNLQNQSDGSVVKRYVAGRGLTQNIIHRFGIGYALNEWQSVTPQLMGVSDQTLISLSLRSESKGKTYDFFRDRLMFPIRNVKGVVVAFGGRILGDGTPKYLNSSESDIFKKRNELYGLYELRHSSSKIREALVVEGYMDVVALAMNEVNNAVAPLGTAITTEQLTKLFRYVDEATVCFDGDKAGRDAAKRAFENGLTLINDQKIMNFVFMPDGEDPDSLINKNGTEYFKNYIKSNKIPLSQYLFQVADSQVELASGTLEYKSAVGKKLKEYLRQIAPSTFKDGLGVRVAEYLNVKKELVHRPEAVRNRRVSSTLQVNSCSTACYTLLMYPEIAFEVDIPDVHQQYIKIPSFLVIMEIFNKVREKGRGVSSAVLYESLKDSRYYASYSKLMITDVIKVERKNALQIFSDCIFQELESFFKIRLDEIISISRGRELSSSEKHEMMMIVNRNKQVA